jgi:C1A family cysteine protease
MMNKHFPLKFIFFSLLVISTVLAAAIFTSSIFGDKEERPILSPPSEEFIKYLEKLEPQKWPKYSDDGYPLGLIPSPHDLSYFKDLPAVKIEALPASYDLRTTGKLTPIRNQGNCGSCWAFATYGSLESFLRPSENWDFSEQNLIDHHGFDWGPCAGGNTDISTAYLARWSGPIKEEDDPYIYATLNELTVRKHVQDVIFIPPRSSSLNNDLLKQAMMTYGAVYASMYYKSTYYNSSTYAYYNWSEKVGAHGVDIIGWDDNFDKNKFTTPPPGNGAFIARNSWGMNWGQSGYFYVSYYDEFFARQEFSAAFKAEPAVGYTVIYQYDPLGWVGSLGDGSDTGWFSNIFTATSFDPLLAVSFYAAGSPNTYEIYIYTDVNPGQPRSGTLANLESGSLNSPGYYTIPLKVGIALRPGQKFSVVVKQKTTNYNSPIPCEYPLKDYSSQATAHAGESFISSNGNTWSDLHTSWSGQYANSNVCLKAFARLPPLYPPTNFVLQRLENNFIFFKEYIDHLSWEANPKNGTKILKYKFYRKTKGAADLTYQLVSELAANVFVSDQRGLKKDQFYTYRITAVDELGRESEPSEIGN